MPSLPKRPGPYLLTLLVVVLGLLCLWMLRALSDPAIQRAAAATRAARERRPDPAGPARLPAPSRPPAPSLAMDPGVRAMHDELTAPATPPERELELLQELLSLQQRATGGAAYGDNSDVVRALVGEAPEGVWWPRQSPRLRDGRLMDRWNTPYWFHANSATQVEIRSAGPDRNLFTADDLILNGSPAGFGASPARPETAP